MVSEKNLKCTQFDVSTLLSLSRDACLSDKCIDLTRNVFSVALSLTIERPSDFLFAFCLHHLFLTKVK
jgi:hypothetical protein